MTADGRMKAGQEAAPFFLSVVRVTTQKHQTTPHFPEEHCMC